VALQISRRRLVHTPAISAEWTRYAGLGREPGPEAEEPRTQIVMTLAGVFVYHVGRRRQLVDANRVAFVRAGQTSRDSHPRGGDVDCLVLTPGPELVDGVSLPHTALADPRLQLTAARLAAAPPEDAVARQEEALALLERALTAARARDPVEPTAARRLAERAKALLAPAGPLLSLPSLARRLAVSPAYLTDAFRRAEGLPLVRYQQRLRLARALDELPRRDDLTALALDLGFSSHSHFSTAFRAAMGVTPSDYRRQTRRTIQRS
jgi:AraC family transcriptional regulator